MPPESTQRLYFHRVIILVDKQMRHITYCDTVQGVMTSVQAAHDVWPGCRTIVSSLTERGGF